MRKKAIELIVSNWFEIEKGKIRVTNDYLRVQSWQMLKKYGDYQSYDVFIGDYMSKCYDVLQAEGLDFKEAEWAKAGVDAMTKLNVFEQNKEKIIEKGGDVVDAGSVLEKISSYVHASIPFVYKNERQAQDGLRVRNGTKTGYTLITMDAKAIESLQMKGEFGEDDGQSDILSDENSLYVDMDYIISHFYRWYLDNKDKMLSPKQLKFINGLLSVDYSDVTEAEKVEATGVVRSNHNYYLKAIAKKVLKAYNEQKPKQFTEYHLGLVRFVGLVEPMVELGLSDDLLNMNDEMLDYLFSVFDKLQPYLKLTASEHQKMNRKQKDSKVLYKVYNQLIKKKEQYEAILNEVEEVTEDLEQYRVPSMTLGHFDHIPKGAKYARMTGKDGYAVVMDEEEEMEVVS